MSGRCVTRTFRIEKSKGGSQKIDFFEYWIYGYPKLCIDETDAVLKTWPEKSSNWQRKLQKTGKNCLKLKNALFSSFWAFSWWILNVLKFSLQHCFIFIKIQLWIPIYSIFKEIYFLTPKGPPFGFLGPKSPGGTPSWQIRKKFDMPKWPHWCTD